MISSRRWRLEMASSDSTRDIMVMATIWEVYALVEATPISAPGERKEGGRANWEQQQVRIGWGEL
jgi:hypothetical protein